MSPLSPRQREVLHLRSCGLSRKEIDLLRYFLAHPGQVLPRQKILDDVWGRDEFPTTRTIDMHVLKLRRKLGEDPDAPRFLLTVHGVGYRYDAGR